MQDFKKINAWKRSHDFLLEIYKITDNFPEKEKFRLTNQLVRAASSVPTNIAEGSGKDGPADFGRYLRISMGSCSEVEYLLLLAKDLKYIDEKEYKKLNKEIIEIRKMTYAFCETIIN